MLFRSILQDRGLANVVKLIFKPGITPEFQFPPVCVDDQKVFDWQVEAHTNATERFAIFMGGQGRKLTLEARYIIDGEWTIEKVVEQVRNIRTHFYDGARLGKMRWIEVQWHQISAGSGKEGQSLATYRAISCQIKHDGPIMGYNNNAYPMVTIVTMEMVFTSQMRDKGGKAKQDIKHLAPTPIGHRGWY